jgi:hypothetical protein
VTTWDAPRIAGQSLSLVRRGTPDERFIRRWFAPTCW